MYGTLAIQNADNLVHELNYTKFSHRCTAAATVARICIQPHLWQHNQPKVKAGH